MVHLGVRALRMDQELACDAAVLERAGPIRRRYAEAMLKAHIAAGAPLGCAWPPANLTALKERIAMLKKALPSRTQRILGGAAIVGVTAAAAAAAWAAQPPHVVATIAQGEIALAGADQGDSDSYEFHFDGDGAGEPGRRIVMRDGVVISERELTEEEREDVRRAIEEARTAVAEAQIDADEIRRSVDEALRQVDVDVIRAVDHAAIERSIASTIEIANWDGHELTPEERAEIRAAVAEAREAAREASAAAAIISRAEIREAVEAARAAHAVSATISRAEVREALAEARAAMAEARVERAAAISEALAEARAEIHEEAARARAQGRHRRADQLERAADAIDENEELEGR